MSEPVTSIRRPVRLEYDFTAGRAMSRFLLGLAEGRILGQGCPECARVYLPPRGTCPTCGVPAEEEVEVSPRGTVTTFCVVNIPSQVLVVPVPYVCANILLDGADVPIFHLIQECPIEEVRMGLRVEAVWVPAGELKATFESIRHFRPSDEPDAAYDSYREHL